MSIGEYLVYSFWKPIACRFSLSKNKKIGVVLAGSDLFEHTAVSRP